MVKTLSQLLLLAAMLGTPMLRMEVHAESPNPAVGQTGPVSAQFRGCESTGWCRFWIESLDPLGQSVHRVYPDGMPDTDCNEELAIAVRNRLNLLMSSFVHQHKRIVLYGLRERGDGIWAANITVNEAALSEDPALQALRER